MQKRDLIIDGDLSAKAALLIDSLVFIFFLMYFTTSIIAFIKFRRIDKQYNVKTRAKEFVVCIIMGVGICMIICL